jgi:hypothetical protein
MIIKLQQKGHRIQVFQIKSSNELSMSYQHKCLIVDKLGKQSEIASDTPVEHFHHKQLLFIHSSFLLVLPPFDLFFLRSQVNF